MLWRYAAPCILALGPTFFAGVVFARSFRDASNPDLAFGSNIAGSVVGGLAESFSMLLRFQHLLLSAMFFYVLFGLVAAAAAGQRLILAPLSFPRRGYLLSNSDAPGLW